MIDWNTVLLTGLAGVVTALLTGKAFRRILLLPFEWLARKTRSRVDDKLVDEARKDLGVADPTLHEESINDHK